MDAAVYVVVAVVVAIIVVITVVVHARKIRQLSLWSVHTY